MEDLNPRHQVLETCVLPTELTAQGDGPVGHRIDDGIWIERGRNLSGRSAALRGWLYPPVPADKKASLFLLYLGAQPLQRPLEGYGA